MDDIKEICLNATLGKPIIIFLSPGLAPPIALSRLLVAIGDLYKTVKPSLLKITIEVIE